MRDYKDGSGSDESLFAGTPDGAMLFVIAHLLASDPKVCVVVVDARFLHFYKCALYITFLLCSVPARLFANAHYIYIRQHVIMHVGLKK